MSRYLDTIKISENTFLYWMFAFFCLNGLIYSLYGYGFSSYISLPLYILIVVVGFNRRLFGRKYNWPLIRLCISLFVLSFLSLYYQYITRGSLIDRNGYDTYWHGMQNLFMSVSYYIFGVFALQVKNKTNIAHVYLLSILSLIILIIGDNGGIDYMRLNEEKEGNVSHLNISQFILLIIFITYMLSYGVHRLIIVAFSVFQLYVSGGRTSIYIFIAMISMLYIINKPVLSRYFKIGFIVFVVLLFNSLVPLGDDYNARIFFGEGLLSDSSAVWRLIQFETGLSALKDQIILGDMNFTVKRFASVGFYMHNILSYWQQYGFIVFVVLLFVFYSVIRLMYNDYDIILSKPQSIQSFRFYLMLYCFIAVLISMSYTFKLIWFAVGLYSNNEIVQHKISEVSDK